MIVSIVSPGAMGSAIGQVLTSHGVEVRTSLAGRSDASADRAKAAGMTPVMDDQISRADIILSIVPPGDAVDLADRLAPVLERAEPKPIYVDCNAISPQTVEDIADIIGDTGCPFVDAGIIGPPPKPSPGGRATKIYLSGEHAEQVARLQQYGLTMPILPGAVGLASAMKMSYAGITKGFTALGAMMMLAAARGGTAEFLQRELAESQPELLAWLTRAVPNMYSKAYRWVAEMEEISEFCSNGAEAAEDLFDAAAEFYEQIAEDIEGAKEQVAILDKFCRR
jgi:L-threonate 2-dehydrogenase